MSEPIEAWVLEREDGSQSVSFEATTPRKGERLIRLVEPPRWVPVLEAMPAPMESVLVAHARIAGDPSTVCEAMWSGELWLLPDGCPLYDRVVTCWTPLPPGPEGT